MSKLTRYNYSRRMVDHRRYFDQGSEINTNKWNARYFAFQKQRFIGHAIENLGVFYGVVCTCATVLIPVVDVYVREYLYPEGSPNRSQLTRLGRGSTAPLDYLFYKNDHTVDKGRWNHNFSSGNMINPSIHSSFL